MEYSGKDTREWVRDAWRNGSRVIKVNGQMEAVSHFFDRSQAYRLWGIRIGKCTVKPFMDAFGGCHVLQTSIVNADKSRRFIIILFCFFFKVMRCISSIGKGQ